MNTNALKILIGIHRMANAIDRKTSLIVKKYGLSMGQFAVLEALHNKGEMSIGQVQEAILSSCGTMPLIVNNLLKRNLIAKRTDEADRRRSYLSLTEEGEKLIVQVEPENRQMIEKELEIFNNDEQEQMVCYLKKYHELKV